MRCIVMGCNRTGRRVFATIDAVEHTVCGDHMEALDTTGPWLLVAPDLGRDRVLLIPPHLVADYDPDPAEEE